MLVFKGWKDWLVGQSAADLLPEDPSLVCSAHLERLTATGKSRSRASDANLLNKNIFCAPALTKPFATLAASFLAEPPRFSAFVLLFLLTGDGNARWQEWEKLMTPLS